MRLLLDTHIVLWAAISPDRLSKRAQSLLREESNELVYSVASLWEIVIKSGLNRADFKVDPRALRRGLLENDYIELPVTGQDALPWIHRDPFDRLLIAQAIVEGITLVTADALLSRYGGLVRKI